MTSGDGAAGQSPRAYILCATPRSGTTLLCQMLTATGVAGHPASYFRAEDMGRYAEQFGLAHGDVSSTGFGRDYLDAVIAAGRDGTPTFGLRLMWESLDPLLTNLARLFPAAGHDLARLEAAFGPLTFLHLARQDRLAQAVSLVKASQSGLWHRYADGRVLEQEGPPRPLEFDCGAIAAALAELEAAEAGWQRWFAANGIAPLSLTYEALADDPQRALAAVLGALGLNTSAAARAVPDTQPLRNRESTAWIARFRAETAPAER